MHFLGERNTKVSSCNAYPSLVSIVRAIVTPLVQLVLGIIVKRVMGLNREILSSNTTQWTLVKRYINSSLLSQMALKRAFDVLGTHYEMTSVSYFMEFDIFCAHTVC